VRRLIVLLAAASLVLAGCGGGGSGSKSAAKPLTKAEYKAKLEEIAKEVGAKLKANASSSTKPTKQDLAAAKQAINGFADELENVAPPAEVAKAHQDLIVAMHRLANDLAGIFKQVDKAKDATGAITALFGAPAIKLLLKAQQEFKAKGYDLNLSG
jgi:predicted small secreted protein